MASKEVYPELEAALRVVLDHSDEGSEFKRRLKELLRGVTAAKVQPDGDVREVLELAQKGEKG